MDLLTSILRQAILASRDPRQLFMTFQFILVFLVRINLHTYLWRTLLTLCLPEIFNLVLNRKLIVLYLNLVGVQPLGSLFVHMATWTIEIKNYKNYVYQFTHSIFLSNNFCHQKDSRSSQIYWFWIIIYFQRQIFSVFKTGIKNIK